MSEPLEWKAERADAADARAEDLRADLARVTAERDEIKGIVGYPGSESLRAAGLSDSLPDVVRWTHREWLRQTHEAGQRVLREQSKVDAAEARFKDAREALEAWMKVESEMADNHPCPDLALRADYRRRAVALTRAALAEAKP